MLRTLHSRATAASRAASLLPATLSSGRGAAQAALAAACRSYASSSVRRSPEDIDRPTAARESSSGSTPPLDPHRHPEFKRNKRLEQMSSLNRPYRVGYKQSPAQFSGDRIDVLWAQAVGALKKRADLRQSSSLGWASIASYAETASLALEMLVTDGPFRYQPCQRVPSRSHLLGLLQGIRSTVAPVPAAHTAELVKLVIDEYPDHDMVMRLFMTIVGQPVETDVARSTWQTLDAAICRLAPNWQASAEGVRSSEVLAPLLLQAVDQARPGLAIGTPVLTEAAASALESLCLPIPLRRQRQRLCDAFRRLQEATATQPTAAGLLNFLTPAITWDVSAKDPICAIFVVWAYAHARNLPCAPDVEWQIPALIDEVLDQFRGQTVDVDAYRPTRSYDRYCWHRAKELVEGDLRPLFADTAPVLDAYFAST